MYIIKVRFQQSEAFPEVQIIDSELTDGNNDWVSAAGETMEVEESEGYLIDRDSFSCGISRKIATTALRSTAKNLRYQYTEGFLPDATFVFEYDR